MDEFRSFPDRGLDIRVDEQGRMTFVPNPEFAQHYATDPAEEELEELRDALAMLELDEPDDLFSAEHDEWEYETDELKRRIAGLEERADET